MLKISRQEINDVIKSARHPNAGKLSHDYALPLPQREFGEPLKSGKAKRWLFEGMPTGDKSDLQAWIDRAKRFDDMKVKFNFNLDDQTLKLSEDLTLKEQIKKSEEQIKKDQSKKVQLLEQLLNRLGIAAPPAAPGLVSDPARVADNERSNLAAAAILMRAEAKRVADNERRNRAANQSQVQEPIATFDERTAPQGTLPNISGSGLAPLPPPELAPEILVEMPPEDMPDKDKLEIFYKTLAGVGGVQGPVVLYIETELKRDDFSGAAANKYRVVKYLQNKNKKLTQSNIVDAIGKLKNELQLPKKKGKK